MPVADHTASNIRATRRSGVLLRMGVRAGVLAKGLEPNLTLSRAGAAPQKVLGEMQIQQGVEPGGRTAAGGSRPALAQPGWKQSCCCTLRRHCERCAGRAALRGGFPTAFALPTDNLQAEKEVDENTGDGKCQPSRKEIPFRFSSKKPPMFSTLKLTWKPFPKHGI